jgi:AcrR family transcriptional regulator
MTVTTATNPAIIRTRTAPIQKRSSDRVTLLLDAAAGLIDELGIDGLTTSNVAARSKSSVGVVYRYFPNIQTLLRALAARNLERYMAGTFRETEPRSSEWLSCLDELFDQYILMAKNEPGFRSLRFGTIIDERFINGEENAHADVTNEIIAALRRRLNGAELSDELRFDIDVTIEACSALMNRAFQNGADGDLQFVEKARQIARNLLAPHGDSLSRA